MQFVPIIMLVVESIEAGDDDQGFVGRFAGLSFDVDDIDATYTMLNEKGVHFHGSPEKQNWGGGLAHFNDPAGNTLTLVEYPKG